jgi:hypothetical protein
MIRVEATARLAPGYSRELLAANLAAIVQNHIQPGSVTFSSRALYLSQLLVASARSSLLTNGPGISAIAFAA